MLRHSIIAAPAFTLVTITLTACAQQVETGDDAPVAVLACPAQAQPGVPFVVDGGATGDARDFASIALTIEPGSQVSTQLRATFAFASATLVTARLVVVDKQKRQATATCRFAVGDASGVGGPPPATTDPSDPSTNPSTDPNGDPTTTTDPNAVDLTGRFAFVAYDRVQLNALLSIAPSTQCAEDPVTALVDVKQTQNHVQMTFQYCSLSMPTVQDVLGEIEATPVPQEIVDALAPIGPFEWDLDSADPGSRFAPPLEDIGAARTAGATLTDPSGVLPTSSDDPQVVAAGGPAVVHPFVVGSSPLKSFDDQIVYRRTMRGFGGTIASKDEIDGGDLGDYSVVLDEALLNPLEGAFLPTQTGQPSTFKMTRIGDAATCDDIRANLDATIATLADPGAPDGCPTFP